MDNYTFSAFIGRLKEAGELKSAPGAGLSGVKIAKQASEHCKTNSKALLFVKEIPVAVNLLSSNKRIKLALGYSIDAVAEQAYLYSMNPPAIELSFCEAPEYDDVLISELPIAKQYKSDVSGSINMGCVISKDGDTYNCGIYRIQPLNDHKAVMHCYPESGLGKQLAKGEDVPVTIAIGTSPHLIYAAAASLPDNVDELKLASYIHPDEMLFIETDGHPVPVATEIIIQGTVSATETHPEGPFMIHTGEYSKAEPFPVLKIESVKMADNCIYHTTVTGPLPMESAYITRAVTIIQMYRLRAICPDIANITHSLEGVFGKEVNIFYKQNMEAVEEIVKNDPYYGKFEKINLFQDQ